MLYIYIYGVVRVGGGAYAEQACSVELLRVCVNNYKDSVRYSKHAQNIKQPKIRIRVYLVCTHACLQACMHVYYTRAHTHTQAAHLFDIICANALRRELGYVHNRSDADGLLAA